MTAYNPNINRLKRNIHPHQELVYIFLHRSSLTSKDLLDTLNQFNKIHYTQDMIRKTLGKLVRADIITTTKEKNKKSYHMHPLQKTRAQHILRVLESPFSNST